MKNTVQSQSFTGLYHPSFEHDACGIGCVVDVLGRPSHDIVSDALHVLRQLAHRGGAGSEEESGDGAGILTQIPDALYRESGLEFRLPDIGQYGVGMVFLPRRKEDRLIAQAQIETMVSNEGLSVLGWRYVPVNESLLSPSARANRPHIRQVFIQTKTDDPQAFERDLYRIRKRIEQSVMDLKESDPRYVYMVSLSAKTVVYKGMFTGKQVDTFYLDLQDRRYRSAIALVHSRYSTNTFPSWEKAHPYRMLVHNGEINTIRGNINRMKARETTLKSSLFGEDLKRLFPIVMENGSDSANFDHTLEFLVQSGMPLAQALMMMIPEPYENHPHLSDDLKAFYAFSQLEMEAWDGPAAMIMSDGQDVAALLDRNGLRPARYTLTKDHRFIMASEAGVLDIDPEQILKHGQLKPGELLYLDTRLGQILPSQDLKERIARQQPYKAWLTKHQKTLKQLPPIKAKPFPLDHLNLAQRIFGYTLEDINTHLLPMAKDGVEPIAAMGDDAALAVLSSHPTPLFAFFRQSFAQVTNPPLDALREAMMISTTLNLGPMGNLLEMKEEDAIRIKLDHPFLTADQLERLKACQDPLKATILKLHFNKDHLKEALDSLFNEADQALQKGVKLLILSDKEASREQLPIPSVLACSALHHHLTRQGTRTQVSLIVECGDAKEVHDFAVLLGYGASAIHPYLALETVKTFVSKGMIKASEDAIIEHYGSASVKGIIKIMSKMGISTLQSYQGAQIFEALGLSKELVDDYFTATLSRIGGLTLKDIESSIQDRVESAYTNSTLEVGSHFRYRDKGEAHLYNPTSIRTLQKAVQTNDYTAYREYKDQLVHPDHPIHLRHLLAFKTQEPIALDEVEPIESIVKRFKTGAMSYGSISPEAHESLAIAMNRLHGKSNTGEGGEDPSRYTDVDPFNSRNSAIKQIASGRFGVTSDYLIHAKELQIKMAQGAKPGEGGQLPGKKVYPWIAQARRSTPGVGLISPPPHHDIYSIEDLAQLIHDLKNANKTARISVKLVSNQGVGTVAAGVAKGRADGILISGHDGGTGASPLSSIQHAGLPWELGLAEAHQTLGLNHLRSRVFLETDGKLMTGNDVMMAAALGAEEFGFSTAPLVALGCVMARVCHQDTCPMGIATQNPDLRAKFKGKPDDVVNFMTFIARDVREQLAKLGLRSLDELVGRSDLLHQVDFRHGIDLSALLSNPLIEHNSLSQNHQLHKSFDQTVLLPLYKKALSKGLPLKASFPLKNTQRVVGTQLGSEITRIHGAKGLSPDTFSLQFTGSAGQSFGAFIPQGLSLHLVGQANDYVGKGLSGGTIVVQTPNALHPQAHRHSLIGNVAFFGASSGKAFINGCAGERFCVRNSGATVVVEGVGNHACEYMTNGCVVILGDFGYNLAAGMSGGLAYVYDPKHLLTQNTNLDMVDLVELEEMDALKLKALVDEHVLRTDSVLAKTLLQDWDESLKKFIKVYPKDYHRVMDQIQHFQDEGHAYTEAVQLAFNESK